MLSILFGHEAILEVIRVRYRIQDDQDRLSIVLVRSASSLSEKRYQTSAAGLRI